MNDLVERYIHQVGQYLPPKERIEIETELRSQIGDQLDDRFDGTPTPADVASVLAEWGHPYQIAASYRDEQYLIGPDLYPIMMMALRYGWLTVPAIVLFLGIFAELTSSQPLTLLSLIIEPLLHSLYATFIFSGAVVLIFAIVQHSSIKFDDTTEAFDPFELPDVDDPTAVDRFEAAFGITFGTIVMLILLYWLQVGGLTLRFSLSDPGDVTPVPTFWVAYFIVVVFGMIALHLVILRRNRWNIQLWLVETALETLGVFGMYFVLYRPVYEHIIAAHPTLSSVPLVSNAPEIITVISAISILVGRADRLTKLWNYKVNYQTPFSVSADSG